MVPTSVRSAAHFILHDLPLKAFIGQTLVTQDVIWWATRNTSSTKSHCPLWPHFEQFSAMLSNVKLACVSKVRDFFAEAEAKIHLRVKLIFTGRTSHRLSAALLGQPVLECSRTASIQSLSSWDKIATPQTGIYQNICRNFCTIIPKLKL